MTSTTTTPDTLYPLPAGAYMIATPAVDGFDQVTYTPAETATLWPSMGTDVLAAFSRGEEPRTGPFVWTLIRPNAPLREIHGADALVGVEASHYYVIGTGEIVTPEVYANTYSGQVIRPLSRRGTGRVYAYLY